jgi:hypothetical protein
LPALVRHVHKRFGVRPRRRLSLVHVRNAAPASANRHRQSEPA